MAKRKRAPTHRVRETHWARLDAGGDFLGNVAIDLCRCGAQRVRGVLARGSSCGEWTHAVCTADELDEKS